jgi:hypothetical protein
MTPIVLVCSGCGEQQPAVVIAWSADAQQTQLCARCARTHEQLAQLAAPFASAGRATNGDGLTPTETLWPRSGGEQSK